MLPSLTSYSVANLIVSAVALVLAGFAYRHRRDRGLGWACLLFLSVAVWTFGYGMELAQSSLGWKVFWSKFQYLAIATTPAAWFWLAAVHAGWSRSLLRRAFTASVTVPAVTIVLAWTNDDHGLIWASTAVFERGELSVATYEYGVWFGVHVAHAYAMILAGSLLLLRRVREASAYRLQALVLLVAALVPLVGNLLHVMRATPLYPLDLTPFSFGVSAVALCVGLYRFELLRLVPQARDTVVESMQDGVLVVDDRGRIVDANPAAAELVGIARGTLVGRDVREVVARDSYEVLATDKRRALLSTSFQVDEVARHCEVAVSRLESRGAAGGSLVVLRDVTRQKRDAARIQFLAQKDPLTRLPNRELLGERLASVLSARRDGACVAVMFLDIDDFKKVNDHYGHSAGDELLLSVAARLRNALTKHFDSAPIDVSTGPGEGRLPYLLARFGGDEFVVLLGDLESPAGASRCAEVILEAMDQPFKVEGASMRVGTSVGIATHPDDGDDAEALLRAADAAMYEAKRSGGGRYEFFTTRIGAAARRRVELELELHRALESREFELYFQPQVDRRSMETVGFEALLRWNHPTDGLLMPGDFMPVVTRMGLTDAIDRLVIDEACSQWARLFRNTPAPPNLAVNISARQIGSRDLAGVLRDAARTHGVPLESLEIEITEDALMANTHATRQALRALRALGVGVAVDDFGTGFSSLGYLLQFDLDLLKVDRDFVSRIDSDERARRLVEAIVTIGHSLGLEVVAEGIETSRQRDFLARVGCDRLQGYLLGWPVPARDLDVSNVGSPAAFRRPAGRQAG